MSGHDGVAPSHETVAVPDTAGPGQSMVADYTESVVPASARRSNFRMLLTFGSRQLVFGAVLVGYSASLRGALARQLFHGMIARRDLVPFGGGVPLLIAGRLAGAVAVSGATSIQDHEIAQRAASLLGG